ncbi:leucine-rich repeat domain-containing protein [Candidatus Albibeggiatoa sp. nov. NOAA]|uniref:leucine-rich repeat domain-containing protein n=1 Tax=Candidatus Albibeggiatoa sp. nov. NOAA TaxID=3162724 RepID=UPI0032FB53F3|nr:leucine-rich repeat domain-containing protein [Thiotrichaceae bacterium]
MTIRRPWYIYSVLLYLCLNPLLLHADECTNNQCTYNITFDQAGYYLVKTSITAAGDAGMWGMTMSAQSADNQPVTLQAINTGSSTHIGHGLSSWTAFYLPTSQAISLTPYNYQDDQPVLVTLYQNTEQGRVVFDEPILIDSEQTYTTSNMDAGFYIAEVTSTNDSDIYTGLSIQAEQLSNIANGGWFAPESPDSFVSFYLPQPSTVQFNLAFDSQYTVQESIVGSSQPVISVDFIAASGERKSVWQTTLSDLTVIKKFGISRIIDIDKMPAFGQIDWFYRGASYLLESYSIDADNNVIGLTLGGAFSNHTKSFPMPVVLLTDLQKLFLVQAALTDIPDEVSQLEHLVQLDLSENHLNRFPQAILQLTKLQALNLKQAYANDVKRIDIPSEIKQLVNLEKLDMSNNHLYQLPVEFGQLENLVELTLSKNHLTTLPSTFSQLTQLQKLDLSNNSFNVLPQSIYALPSLAELNLPNNHIQTLSSKIAQLQNLSHLNLAANQLTRLPPEIGQLSNLTSLYLDNNQLQTLPPEIGQLQNLTSLSLENNQLTSLPREIGNLNDDLSLNVKGNDKLIEPPLDIVQQGMPAIRAYFANQ